VFDVGEIKNIFVLDGDKTIIDIEKFYDCLNLVKKDNIKFQGESTILLKRCVKQCKENLTQNRRVVLIKSNVVEREFHSTGKFEEWLNSDENMELGIELIKFD
jgi:hypothetical protein